MKNGKNSKELARAVFYLNVKKFFGEEKAEEIKKELKVKDLYIEKARGILCLDKLIQ